MVYGGGSGGPGGSGGGGSAAGGGTGYGGADEQELPSYNQAPAGSIRFNTDSAKLEVYIGGPVGYGTTATGQWMQVDSWSPDTLTGGTRGLCAGGFLEPDADATDTINVFNMASTGNATDFGDLTQKRYGLAGCSSRVRGLFGGGRTDPAPTARFNIIDEVTIASTGTCTDYGDLDTEQVGPTAFSSSTRGVFAGGYNPTQTDKIQYVTIAVKEDAIDFGNLTATRFGAFAVSDGTRGVIAGGETPGTTRINIIEFVTISTTGNSADFGDLSVRRRGLGNGGGSNAVRGIFANGVLHPSGNSNTIDYITIATLGDAKDFGDLVEVNSSKSGCASPTRVCFAGGQVTSPGTTNSIEYVQIMSLGNAVDFGDIQFKQEAPTSLSNGHGGLCS